MPTASTEESLLLTYLLEQPQRNRYSWSYTANCELRRTLFRSLAKQRDDYLRLFFPHGPPTDEPWSLRAAQGAIEGAEYSAAAKGTACGHIFKPGESTYQCKTCAADDTCVLCARCFEASDHEDHVVFISVSPGNSGCCDCGDAEAWRREVKCTIHSADTGVPQAQEQTQGSKDKAPVGVVGRDLPPDLVEAIRMTISRAVDYLCDVFSCSPEMMRQPKTQEGVREDEEKSRLEGLHGYHGQETNPECEPMYALVLWNDEKHTVYEVQNQVARACKQSKTFGYGKAMEVNDVGRSIVWKSGNLEDLLRMAGTIEQLRVTVTVRSARDTFREEMCAAIIDWISDIAGCSVGSDAHLLKTVICEELLKPWRIGSRASNRDIAKDGIDDHEIEDNMKLAAQYRAMMEPMTPAVNVIRVEMEALEDDENDDDNDDGDQMDYDDDMEISAEQAFADATVADADMTMDMDFLGNDEDITEALEATIAGYPPPPPPPRASRRNRVMTPAESEDGDPDTGQPNPPFGNIPKTPRGRGKQSSSRPSKHWLVKPEGFRGSRPTEPCEDLWQRVRLDWLILWDLRLWKTLRVNLRHLYITTLVTVPQYKRILGLRFAGLYTTLAQLYLIADREPDHSIVNLTVQVLTTPSITQEVVERGNFLTNLMAILYTFLTTRQVGFPEEVSPKATLAFDAGAVANRRLFHFFLDLRWLLQSDFIQYHMRMEPHYLLQFLDLVKLHQGICPNVRATGEHVEYESDAWITASMIVKEINRLCKLAAISFEPKAELDESSIALQRAVRMVAQVVMINSLGLERKRFMGSEWRGDLAWHSVGPFGDTQQTYRVPAYVVQSEPMSFHHPLHYLLSWLIENAKGMSRDEMLSRLYFTTDDLKDPWNVSRATIFSTDLTYAELLCSIFDHPLRVCVWLAQMKAGMWVRNGITLRHQAHTYRSVAYRDVGYQRDILLVQAGLVLCGSDGERPGERFLAQMIDRFQMDKWLQGDFSLVPGFDHSQQIDMLEDFFHLLVIAICERGNLIPSNDRQEQHERLLRHDIAHALCFKPLSFSELSNRVTEKVSESDDFSRVLESMTAYRAPEGLNDTGTFELKPEYIELVDPYYAHFSRNQREESENVYKRYMARKTGKAVEDVVYEPTLQPIESGLFANISAFTSTPLFVQAVDTALTYAAGAKSLETGLQITRIETFLHMVLHLILVAIVEDGEHSREFVRLTALQSQNGEPSVVSNLITLLSMQDYATCHPTIKHILRKMQLRQPEKLTSIIGPLGVMLDRGDSSSPASITQEDKERKKQEALARQARIMAQMKQQQNSFLQNQGMSGFDDEFEDDMSISEEPETIEQTKLWHFPTGTCIWCQEETDDQRLYGTFSFFGESNILRSTPSDDAEYISEVINSPESLDRPADTIRPFGVAGNNKRIVRKVMPDGSTVSTERQGLSRGFPHQEYENKGPVATTCGHIMHFTCFELYMQHSYRRHTQQIARNHPERMDLREFTCPLCKALGNAFLPIIWKAKECSQEYELHAAKSFDDWLLLTDEKYSADPLTVGPSRMFTPHHAQALSNRSSQYITTNFSPPLVAAMNDLSIHASPPPETSPRRRQSLLRSLFSRGDVAHDVPTSSPSRDGDLPRMAELTKAYTRLDETIKANDLGHLDDDGEETISAMNTLSRALGMSVSAYEIAHRGTTTNVGFGTSLIPDIPEQILTHFRILSETIESYLAVNVLRPSPFNPVALETGRRREGLTRQLFAPKDGTDDIIGAVLFEDDTFLFFVDWLSFMAPSVAEASNVLQLCLWAEIVKAMDVCKSWAIEFGAGSHGTSPKQWDESFLRAASSFAPGFDWAKAPGNLFMKPEHKALFRYFAERYALAFLRKAIVVMYVRYGLDFECPYDVDPEAPELDRLIKLLHLLPVGDMVELACRKDAAGEKLRGLSTRWTQQAHSIREEAVSQGSTWNDTAIQMPHPAIFELVGLPKTYDALTEEAVRRKCPTTGKDISDPAICLFCGDIFCSQATCCMKNKNEGGCYQHMAKCGGTVGVFINVRKCMVLFMHGQNGSFIQAPYLDKHGEHDPSLRRRQQLFLNQRRYDKLMREVWLLHGIPTVISRKLEADNNPGGWETL